MFIVFCLSVHLSCLLNQLFIVDHISQLFIKHSTLFKIAIFFATISPFSYQLAIQWVTFQSPPKTNTRLFIVLHILVHVAYFFPKVFVMAHFRSQSKKMCTFPGLLFFFRYQAQQIERFWKVRILPDDFI